MMAAQRLSAALFLCATLAQVCAFSDLISLNEGNGLTLTIERDNISKIITNIGIGRDLSNITCIGEPSCVVEEGLTLTIKEIENGYSILWESSDIDTVLEDCIDLEYSTDNNLVHWYGGPQRYTQTWPVESMVIPKDEAYVLKKQDNFAVAERYWLNSKGGYVFVSDTTPLFVDQNNEESQGLLCFIAKAEAPYINRTRVHLEYNIVALDDPKQAHLHAVNNYLGKPSGHPNEKMITEPIWTTWAKFKKSISDEIVLSFAEDIISHGFTKGQVEIDEDWEICFGIHKFKTDNFANINNTVAKLKENFRVSLWIAPFVNGDCEEPLQEGLANGYFVANTEGNMTTVWWESEDAYQIDFTNPEAAQWYADKVYALKESPGVDSFKFDAGETNYVAQPAVYSTVDQEQIPNIFSKKYIETVSQFGDLIEYRSAWRTQNLPHFLRMIDKDSVWGLDDGLQSLITTLLQLNMNGYTMILPDMIGGNGYRQQPTAELIVRWAQATVFMPAMQFSFLPWDFPTDEFNATDLIRQAVELHEKFAPEILKAMNDSITYGTPVNPPIWWVDPTDQIAHNIWSEFMLGENILVAPVLIEGGDVMYIYLPKGVWTDGNTGEVSEGPIYLNYYPTISTLPYFIRQS